MRPNKSPRSPKPEPAKPAKRFRISKLEERIAPTVHYNPHTKLVGNGRGTLTCTA